MRYDDRGIGGSGGLETLENATSEDFATDARAIVEHLQTIAAVDSKQIGLVGHSEGGVIAPMVARDHDDIAFIVTMAGPGVVGKDLLAKQVMLGWSATGADEDAVQGWGADFAPILDRIVEGADKDEILPLMLKIGDEQAAAGFASPDAEQRRALIEAQATVFVNPWMRFFLAYDPAPALRALKCPVLAINGTLDLQVWHEQNLDAIKRIINEAGGDVTIKRYERLNHLFQPAKTGAAGEYANIEITFDEQVMTDIADWITARTSATP
jgi:pimeloyl-ACP methyl ester carboxylesterase